MPSEVGGNPELPQPEVCVPPLPVTERGFGIHIDGTLNGTPRLVRQTYMYMCCVLFEQLVAHNSRVSLHAPYVSFKE